MKDNTGASVLYSCDGNHIVISPADNAKFSLKELYGLIDTNIIQIIPLYRNRVMILDEEGKMKQGKEVNETATLLAHQHGSIFPRDFIVGDVVVCDRELFD